MSLYVVFRNNSLIKYPSTHYFVGDICSPQQMISHTSTHPQTSSTLTTSPHVSHTYLLPFSILDFFLPPFLAAVFVFFFAVFLFVVFFFVVFFFTVFFFVAFLFGAPLVTMRSPPFFLISRHRLYSPSYDRQLVIACHNGFPHMQLSYILPHVSQPLLIHMSKKSACENLRIFPNTLSCGPDAPSGVVLRSIFKSLRFALFPGDA